MAVLNLTLPLGELPVTGKQVTFEAPCDSEKVTGIVIKDNAYDLVDSIGNPIVPNAFNKGAMVSVILNNETSKAFIQNPSTTKYLEEKLKEITTVLFFETVADMKASSNLTVGLFVETGGYFAERDGGGCLYRVISNKEKSYDIEGKGIAFRPIVNGVAYPKMFGTYNDGRIDNEPLQACFDYVADYGIPTIDGAGFTYCVNHTTDAITHQDKPDLFPKGITHHGVIIRTGVELKNYKSVLKSYSDVMTPVLTLLQSETNSFYIHDCEFYGNYGDHKPISSGALLDGGRHLLFFTFEDTLFPSNFRDCGDITIERCKLHYPESYPIMLSACACTFTVKDCDIKSLAMGILTHATNCVIRDCTFEADDHYNGVAHNFCHDGIDFSSNYTGGFRKKVEISNCHCKGTPHYIYSISQPTQNGVNYESIKIIDCINNTENGGFFYDYIDTGTYTTRQKIDSLEIRGCSAPYFTTELPIGTDREISIYGADINNVTVEDTLLNSCRIWRSNVDKVTFKDLKNAWNFTMLNSGAPYSLKEVDFDNVSFHNYNSTPFTDISGIETLKLRNCICKNRMRLVESSSTVTKLNIFIENLLYDKISTDTYARSFILIGESGEYNITVKDSQFFTGWGTNNFINVESESSTATGTIILQNVLAVDLPIINRNLKLVKMNVAFIDGIKDLVGIETIEQTTTSTVNEGENIITVTLTDGTKQTFTVRNGSQGSQGVQGNGIYYATYRSFSGDSNYGFFDLQDIELHGRTAQIGDFILFEDVLYKVTIIRGDIDLSVEKIISLKGKEGVSVTISEVSESTESGGSNVITFSDGTTVTIMNGKDYTLTSTDKNEIATSVKAMFSSETWTFTLVDGSTVTKKVALI